MPIKPMLGEIELQQAQKIETDEDQILIQHSVPALEGDFLQGLGRRATRVTLTGVMTGAEAAENLRALRELYRDGAPVSFVADIATATKVDQVLIEELGVRELAGRPSRFEYELTLRELIPPPPPEVEPPPPEVEPPPVETGTLVVEVIVEGEPNFDFSAVTVTIDGTTEEGSSLARTLTNRTNNVWEEVMPPGQYLVQAATNPRGSATAQIRPAQTTRVTITLRSGAAVAETFIVHFRFDKAFVEPCLREVLRQVAARAANTDEKLLIVGHTDRVDTPQYNQSLSERRARAVFAFLTFRNDRATAVNEWDALRKPRATPGGRSTIEDRWGTREYQHILQDLGFYPGRVDGDHGPVTDDAVRAYRCHKGLPPGTQVDDEVWRALIEDYLAQDNLGVSTDRFFPNCPGEIVKWLGCGEEDPVNNTPNAHRPNRRVELLFVRADRLPCEVPRPDTFDLPQPGAVNGGWCVGPPSGGSRFCFVTPHLDPATRKPQPCSPTPGGPFCREPADPRTITVQGSISHEDGSPAANQSFVIITPKGEFLQREDGRGEAVAARTDSNGNFSFADKPVGVYSLEIQTPVLARLREQGDDTIKGNAVCKLLQADSDRLDVVIVDAPLLREIRLPVAAHLMTALHPVTREIRTCPAAVGPPGQQTTRITDAELRAAFDEANRIWRQARIRFELDDADIVREAYAFRTECEVDESEFTFLLERCAYPDVVNVFFFGDLAGLGEAGFGISPEGGAVLDVSGCAVGDVFQTTILGPPVSMTLDAQQRVQALAHELGHFLNLDHADNTPANANRLMLSGTFSGANRILTRDEVNRARASRGATDDCVPLSLQVTGATRVGGGLSNQFIVIQDPAGAITVDAQIPDRLVAPGVGALTMTGGNPGANDRQRVVSAATTGVTEVIATYTPAGGGQPVTTRVAIRVATFELTVDGAARVSPGSNTFVVSRHPTQVVTVIANIAPAPFCVPGDLVTWAGGNEAPDPLRRTVPRAGLNPTTVTATVAGVTRTVTIIVIEVRITEVALVGQNQTVDIPITITPTPLPAGVSITLQLTTTAGTGEARFVNPDSASMTITQTTTVRVRGVAASSVADNIRLTARITGQADAVAQEDFTVVGVTIASVMGVKPGQTIDIPVTVTPSPLPAGSSLTLELSVTSGTGAARFASGNPTTMAINQSSTVTVQGVTPSSVTDNIRLAVRITGQTQTLAQEDFSVLNAINIFLKFEVWNLNTRAFEPLPAGVRVDLMDEDLGPDDSLTTGRTDGQGRVLFTLPNFAASGEDAPDLFFLARPNGLFHAGHILPNEWSTKGWRATDGSPGLFEDFTGAQLGSEAAPLTYRIGLDIHARLNYHVDAGGRAGNTDPAPKGVGVSFFVNGALGSETRKRTFTTDENGEIHGVIFDVEGGDSVFLRVDFDIRDSAINLNRARVDISPWDTEFDDNDRTSIGAQTAPLVLHANSDERNVALYFLKILRELSTFLFHLTGGVWTGFEELTFFRSSISGVAFSWPVGDVNLPPGDHWDRGTIIHEVTHQTMWKEHDRSSADIAFEALFGDLSLTHFEFLLSNPEHALIEGWPEFTQAVFAGVVTPPYVVIPVADGIDGSGNLKNPRPLGPPPNNRGASVEGAFANGLWGVFENHVITPAVFTAAGAADAHVPESVNGDVVATAPWITNADVRRRFLSMIWNPFRDLRQLDKTTNQMFSRIRARNGAVWHLLQAELQAFNMAMDIPTITAIAPNSGPAGGGQAVTMTGTNFTPGMQVQFAQAPAGGGLATNVVVTNSDTLTAVTPAGVAGPANVIVRTRAGSATLPGGYAYV